MKLPLASLTVVLLLTAGPSLHADEPPDLERQFISGLRSRGMSQLALEYLEQLQKKEGLDPALKKLLPLEIARTRVILARSAPLEKRAGEYRAAREELEKFALNNKTPEGVQAGIEVARIVALQGKVQLSRAVRQETPAARLEEALKARQFFAEAGTKLQGAIKSLDDQMVKYKGSEKKDDEQALETLKRDKLQAQFDLGINLLLQSQTYFFRAADSGDAQRGTLAVEAEKVLQEVAKEDDQNPLCQMARVWLIPCSLAMDSPKQAFERCDRLRRLKKPDAVHLDAKLLAEAFHISMLSKDSKVKNPLAAMRTDGQAWLKSKDLARFGKAASEGYGVWIRLSDQFSCYVPSSAADVKDAVRFTVALSYFLEADNLKAAAAKAKRPTPTRAVDYFKEAQKLLGPLEETENDLTQEARGLNEEIFIAIHGKKGPARPKTFKDLYLQANAEKRKLSRATKDSERKQHLQNIALALNSALNLADSKVASRDLLKAGSELADVYLNLGDPYRAAVLGDYLTRTNPPGKETLLAAAFALEAFVRILDADYDLLKKAGQEQDAARAAEVRQQIEADRDHFRSLAHFVESQPEWKDETVIPYTRYQRARFALREDNNAEAVELLSSLSKTWAGYQLAQCQLVFAALRLTEDNARRPETETLLGFRLRYQVPVSDVEKAKFEKKAREALARLELTEQANPLNAHFYFAAKLKECRLLYREANQEDIKAADREKKYQALEKLANALQQQFTKLNQTKDSSLQKLDQKVRDDLRQGVETWLNYAKVGQAELAYSTGAYDTVLTMTAPYVKRVEEVVAALEAARAKKDEKAEAALKGKLADFDIVRSMLELALRANVQKSNRVPARQILVLLQKIASEPDLTGDPVNLKPTEILVRLVFQLRAQVQELRQKKSAAQAEKDASKEKEAQVALDKTVANFTEFLDELTKDLDKLTRQLDEMAGQGGKKSLKSQVLGLLARSYASLDKHQQAADLLSRIPAPKGQGGKEPTAQDMRRYLEFQLLYAQELRKAGQFTKALAILDGPNFKTRNKQGLDAILLALEADKEKIVIEEAQRKYGSAATKWTRFLKDPRLTSLLKNRDFKGILAKYKVGEKERLDKKIQDIKAQEAAGKKDANQAEREQGQAKAESEQDVRRVQANLRKMYRDVLKLYWDGYYHKTYCLYHYGKKSNKEKTRTSFIRLAANNIKKLKLRADELKKDEEQWTAEKDYIGWTYVQDQFDDLLKAESVLRKQYKALKKG